jgi:hypothetical protein
MISKVYPLFFFIVFSQAIDGDREDWLTASEALEMSIEVDKTPDYCYDRYVIPLIDRFNAELKTYISEERTSKGKPYSIDFTVKIGSGDGEIPYICTDVFTSKIIALGFRLEDGGRTNKYDWNSGIRHNIGIDTVTYKIEWGKVSFFPQKIITAIWG